MIKVVITFTTAIITKKVTTPPAEITSPLRASYFSTSTPLPKKGGESCYWQGKGIFSLTREQRAELGRIRGRRTYEARIGIHAQSREEKRAAVREGLLRRGIIPYSDEEKKALVELANDPPYQHPEGARQAGKPNYEKIREKKLDEFGVERTVSSLKTMYYRINREQRPRA